MKTRVFIAIICTVIFCTANMSPAYAKYKDTFKSIKKIIAADKLSKGEIVKGLREALHVGTDKATKKVSRINGYYKNPRIRIPLPKNIRRVRKLLIAAGGGSQVKAFELSMNRAAERAAPKAKTIFWKALKQMTFSDARKIFRGRDNEATLYFKKKTSPRLYKIFKPVVHKASPRRVSHAPINRCTQKYAVHLSREK